ncbi:SDR family NAD(P)-dependent oxidoreductase [Eubacterium multiforme]|uniref:3-oxoacyl-[acyl-carrier protein] reductase/7-alpha-hydroxysteroid dehydrogenase n=1 Tax=Eubacterium multiforme TaxID=83339 RepID=A0ABT9URW0_9FIRM|nr:glucose 1-dehydrogenase [Eubacterium multiforme]MDQ0148664.1 3-oxoacyl-[acyl-carrier protein] reductase/7-alpha-hydroxysteroid dehydrogenase [Eubacterium multiforme]
MDSLSKSIENKVVIVTGGTRGIGFATVKKFLLNGAKVVLCGSKKESVYKALEELKKINPSYKVMGFYPNLLNTKEIDHMADLILEKWGRIDVLINNAGVSDNKTIYDQTYENFSQIMDINVQAVFNCSKIFAEIMKEQKSGAILNTSSVVSLYGQKAGVGYPTSKFAVNGLTKSLARELGKDGIRVNAVAPGIISTDMVKELDKELVDGLIQNIPVGRIGEAEDIANAFLFLASDMASYVSGEILSVDGAVMI